MDNNNMYNQSNPQGEQQYSSYYEPPIQPQAQGPVGQELEEPVSVGEWMISMLLLMIPCVNIVLMFVWAFSDSEKKSKSNYFKASLIWTGIGIGIWIVMILLMSAGIFVGLRSM